jgi:hypothetical protein
MRKIFTSGSLMIALMMSTSGVDAQAMRAVCHVDTLCAGVQNGGGRIMKCLREHKSELSEECLAAIGRTVMSWGGGKGQGQGGQGQGQGGQGGGGPGGPPSEGPDGPQQ